MTRILIVDDALVDIERLSFSLKDCHEVLTVSDGLQGLNIAATERSDLILLDVMMPEINGIEVCRRLTRDYQASPICLFHVTATGLDDNVLAGLDAGAHDYFLKPYRKESPATRSSEPLRNELMGDRSVARKPHESASLDHGRQRNTSQGQEEAQRTGRQR